VERFRGFAAWYQPPTRLRYFFGVFVGDPVCATRATPAGDRITIADRPQARATPCEYGTIMAGTRKIASKETGIFSGALRVPHR
jgi:hypothetical protein